jgi:hypothetical protein
MLAVLGTLPAADWAAIASQPTNFEGKDVFNRIVSRADEGKWCTLPIGELMGNIAQELIGTKYVGGTLDLSRDREVCTVNLKALDCVTFFETTLAFARMLKKEERTPDALLTEVSFTRYRHGALGDYSTRLHYTTDWFEDNKNKHVVKLLSNLPGAEPFKQKVDFMSSHPNSYPQLVAHPELIPLIKQQEDAINKRSLKFIPMHKISAIESHLKTGDIVGVCTNQPGLDIVHTGIVFRDTAGITHFMDASSKKSSMQVTIEPGPISQALNWSKNLTGIMLARPMEPKL